MKYIISLLVLLTSITSKSQIILPFELYENKYVLIKIPGINNQDTLTFYFDTGASTTLINKETAKKYNIIADFQQSVPGASGNKIYEIATNQQIYLTQQKSINHINIVIEDLTRLNGSIGKKFDGIIGNDILKDYLTQIDFDKKQIYLYPFNSKLEKKGYTEIDFTFNNSIPIPQFPITIELLNGEKFSGNILFDSGAGILLYINTPFQQENNIINKVGKTIVSTQNDLSNKTEITLSVIKSLSIGTYKFDGKLPVRISTDNAGVSSYKGYLGILGSDIINRFNIILDYSIQKLYLKPNNLYNNNFTTAVSPMKLTVIDDKIVIESIIENSQAYLNGLREGQTIVSINGFISKDISKYRELLLEEGKEVEVKYIDDRNVEKKCRFELEKVF